MYVVVERVRTARVEAKPLPAQEDGERERDETARKVEKGEVEWWVKSHHWNGCPEQA